MTREEGNNSVYVYHSPAKKSNESNLNEKRKGNVKVKEMMFKQRQMKRSASITMKPNAINVEEYRPSNKSQSGNVDPRAQPF